MNKILIFLTCISFFSCKKKETCSDNLKNGNETETDCGGECSPCAKSIDYSVTDIDNNKYKTVPIGDQVWMAENLKVTKFNNGELIPEIIDDTSWSNVNSSGWCNYDNNYEFDDKYGKLYNLPVINSIYANSNVCPVGWHVPSSEDISELVDFLGGNSNGGKLKIGGTTYWNSPNYGATNEFLFAAVGGGYRDNNGNFSSFKDVGFWWISSEKCFSLHSSGDYLFVSTEFPPAAGYSIRCIKD